MTNRDATHLQRDLQNTISILDAALFIEFCIALDGFLVAEGLEPALGVGLVQDTNVSLNSNILPPGCLMIICYGYRVSENIGCSLVPVR